MKQDQSRCFLVGGALYQPQRQASAPCALLSPRPLMMAPQMQTLVASALPVRF